MSTLEFETKVDADLPTDVQGALIMREIQEAGAALAEKPTTIRVTRAGEVIREYVDGKRTI